MFNINDYMPEDLLMAIAWRDCMLWAVKEADIMEAFKRETGFTWEPGRPGIERLIDEATGMDRAFAETFIPWFTENVWGKVAESVGEAMASEDER